MLKPIRVIQLIVLMSVSHILTTQYFSAEIENKNIYQNCIACHETEYKHWQQPLQNWNGMCADCHSDGLKRNYAEEDDVFKTKNY